MTRGALAETGLCGRPMGSRLCRSGWVQASAWKIFQKTAKKIGRKEKRKSSFIQFLIHSLHSPSLDCACLMSWHLVFHFCSPHSCTPALPLRAHTGSSSPLLFFSVQCSSRWRSQCFEKGPRRGEKKGPSRYVFFFFFDNQGISNSLSPVFRAKGARSARGGAIVEQYGRSNNGANKRKKFAQVGGLQTWAHA